MFECSREQARPRQPLRPKRVTSTAATATATNGSASPSLNKRANMMNGGTSKSATTNGGSGLYSKDEVNVESLDFTKKILHTAWHPKDNIVAIAATNNLYIYYTKDQNNLQSLNSTTSYNNCYTNSNTSNTNPNYSNLNGTSSVVPTNTTNGVAIVPTVTAAATTTVNNDSSCLTLNTSFYTPSSTSTNTSNSSSLLSTSPTSNGTAQQQPPPLPSSTQISQQQQPIVANSMSLWIDKYFLKNEFFFSIFTLHFEKNEHKILYIKKTKSHQSINKIISNLKKKRKNFLKFFFVSTLESKSFFLFRWHKRWIFYFSFFLFRNILDGLLL
jgi:hypothetical protein